MAEIRLDGVHKRFDDFVAVKDSSFTINDGEFFVLLGPSGCGKTTTLRMIAGLELPTSGKIRLAGDDVSHLRASQRDIAFVFQLFALYPHMNVAQNLGYPLRSEGVPRREVRERVAAIAQMLRIEHLLKKGVSGLAGGDRQRVALGRAIIRQPQAFLMDEPLGTLDTEFRELMCEELKQLHSRMGATTVYVTHDQLEAMAMADKIAVMSQGEVLQVASPQEIYHQPRWKFVANFIGSPAMNFMPARAGISKGESSVTIAGVPIEVPELFEDTPAQVALGVRPEYLEIRPAGEAGSLAGKVFEVEYMGCRQLLTVDTAAGRLKVRANEDLDVRRDDAVSLKPRKDAVILFDNNNGRAFDSALFTQAPNTAVAGGGAHG